MSKIFKSVLVFGVLATLVGASAHASRRASTSGAGMVPAGEAPCIVGATKGSADAQGTDLGSAGAPAKSGATAAPAKAGAASEKAK